MKNIPMVIIAFLCMTALCPAADSTNSVRIITSFYPIYIHTLNVTAGAEGITVANLVKPTAGCLHDYAFTAGDLVAVTKADIMIINGNGMESFIDKALKGNPKLKILDSSKGIETVKDSHGVANPHVWVSISGAIGQVENIAKELASADPARAQLYSVNASNYVARLQALRQKMNDGLKDISKRDIITFHEAFPYFAREFDLKIVGVINREPGSEPTARELIESINAVKASGAKAIFIEPQYSTKAADVISRETGIGIFKLDPAVTGDVSPDAYIKTMERNLLELQKALK